MFGYETEHIIRKIQNKILGIEDHVSLRSILSAPIHDAIKIYFRASIADMHGNQKQFHTERAPDIEKLKTEIDLVLPSNYTITRDKFISLLTDAVHFQFNYLCRPRWTMKEFFFQNSSSLTLPELQQRFLYFSAYDHYPRILFRYLHTKKIKHIDSALLDSLILKINRLVLSDASPDDFVVLLKPLASFIGYGREDKDEAIPERALLLFFEDLGFESLHRQLEESFEDDGMEKIALSTLHDYLSRTPETGITGEEKPVPEESPGEAEIDDQSEQPPAEQPTEEETTLDQPDYQDELPDLDKNLRDQLEKWQETQDPETEKPEEHEEPPVIEEPIEEKPEPDEDDFFQLIQRQEESSEEPGEDEEKPVEEEPGDEETAEEEQPDRPSSTPPPLEHLIDDDERKRFIRKLFNGDAAYYNVVIETLNKIMSWKEASLYIDEVFLMNGVDPYSTDSVNFTDKVYTKFSHTSRYK